MHLWWKQSAGSTAAAAQVIQPNLSADAAAATTSAQNYKLWRSWQAEQRLLGSPAAAASSSAATGLLLIGESLPLISEASPAIQQQPPRNSGNLPTGHRSATASSASLLQQQPRTLPALINISSSLLNSNGLSTAATDGNGDTATRNQPQGRLCQF
jgi:hypothetical protein